MAIECQRDAQGNPIAVVIPIAEWEAMQQQLSEKEIASAALSCLIAEWQAIRQEQTSQKAKSAPIEKFGMTPAEGKDTRSRLETFAQDWESPEMDAYDNYDDTRKSLETR